MNDPYGGKYCVNCKNHKVNNHSSFGPQCWASLSVENFDPVYGPEPYDCKDVRSQNGACGVEGKLFEAVDAERS